MYEWKEENNTMTEQTEQPKEKKSNVQLIIDALMTGASLRSKEISDRISEAAGREIKVQDVASMLSRISNPDKCELGFFIRKEPDGNSYIYSIPEEVRETLSEQDAYGLTLKTGKDRYSLDQAVEEHPELQRYVEEAKARPRMQGRRGRKSVRGRKPKAVTARMNRELEEIGLSGAQIVESLGALEAMLDRLREVGEVDVNVNVRLSVSFEGIGK